MQKSSDDQSALDLVGAVAFDLAILERHHDRNFESGSLIQKIASAQKKVEGSLGEVLAATENLLHCMQQELIPDVQGSFQALSDVAQYLHDSTNTDAQKEEDNAIVDELLERIDFLASGGIDSELPRSEHSTFGPPTVFHKLKFPIEAPEDVEDPLLATFAEQLASSSQLLSSRFGSSNEGAKSNAVIQHNRITNAFVHQVQEQSHEKLSNLFKSLRAVVFENEEGGGLESRVKFSSPADGHSLYKSTANLFSPIFERLLRAFRQLLVSNIDAFLAVDVQSADEEVAVVFNFEELKSRYAKRMDATVSTVLATDSGTFERDIAESSHEPEVDAFGRELASLLAATRRVGGSLKAKPNKASGFSIDVHIPIETRLFTALQLRIDSNHYAVEANLIQGVVPASFGHCDYSLDKVTYEDISYDYVTLGVGKPIHDIDANDRGMLVFLQTEGRSLALRADEVLEIVQMVRQPSSSGVTFGNLCNSDSEAIMLLDFLSPRNLKSRILTPTTCGQLATRRIYLYNTTETTAAKFEMAVKGKSIECRRLQGVASTIAEIQEQQPTLLVFELHSERLDGLENFARIEPHIDVSRGKCLVLVDSPGSHTIQENARFSSLPQASCDLSANEFRDLITTQLGL